MHFPAHGWKGRGRGRNTQLNMHKPRLFLTHNPQEYTKRNSLITQKFANLKVAKGEEELKKEERRRGVGREEVERRRGHFPTPLRQPLGNFPMRK